MRSYARTTYRTYSTEHGCQVIFRQANDGSREVQTTDVRSFPDPATAWQAAGSVLGWR
jgi:hypothetical protein